MNNYYVNFIDRQMHADNLKGEGIMFDLLSPTQQLLVKFIEQFNTLCIDLNMKFADDGALDTTANDVVDLNARMLDVEDWTKYVSKVSTKVLDIEEKKYHSHYTAPIKDEYGCVVEGAWSTPTLCPDPDPDELLRIDKNGNIWIDGAIETSTISIGNAIKRMAEQYKEDIPINNIEQLNL